MLGLDAFLMGEHRGCVLFCEGSMPLLGCRLSSTCITVWVCKSVVHCVLLYLLKINFRN